MAAIRENFEELRRQEHFPPHQGNSRAAAAAARNVDYVLLARHRGEAPVDGADVSAERMTAAWDAMAAARERDRRCLIFAHHDHFCT